MMVPRVFVVAATVALAGCGGSGDNAPDTADDAPSTTSAPVSTRQPAVTTATTTTPPATTTAPTTAPPTTAPPTTAPPTAPSVRSVIESGTVLNLAHAGGDQDAPHSTRFAFEQAVRAGATALELDVQLTADDVLIVQHDDTVDKTTETTGRVDQLTLAEIQALDNAYWFSPECWPCQDRPASEYTYRGVRNGLVSPPDGSAADDFRVPTFREIATAFPDMLLDIEIKGSPESGIAVAERLALELEELGRLDSVVVVSFDDEVVDAFHELAPTVAVSPGLGRLTAWFLDGAELEPHFEILQLPPFQGEIEVVTAALVERIHAEGRVVWVWPDDASTQENAEFYAQLLADGVDGVIAGRPAAMTAALRG